MSATNKAIAKRLKNKGLQRLRWFCQMCQKQCRDENGFKNHCTTENHLRNMERFSAESGRFVDTFSRDFEKAFVDVLSHHHHTKRMNANYVYNEMIQDKTHVHMNATRWDSLASFVKHLGSTGKCVVDETERGWFVKWIDPEERARELGRKKREEDDVKAQERRTRALLKRQQDVSNSVADAEHDTHIIEGEREETNEEEHLPVDERMVVMRAGPNKKLKSSLPLSIFAAATADSSSSAAAAAEGEMKEDDDKLPSTWLMPDIVVKIVSGKVGPGLKNEKAVILDVHEDDDEDGPTADLILLKTGADVSRVSAKRLETVIPKVGGHVMILAPRHPKRGSIGVVESVNQKDCCVDLRLKNGQVFTKIDFEDISKVFDDDADPPEES